MRSVYKQEDGTVRVREGKQNRDGYLLEREKEQEGIYSLWHEKQEKMKAIKFILIC